jgi:LemA protein
VLAMAWERAERDDAHDLAGPRLPDTVTSRRAQLAMQTHAAIDQFDRAVVRYNDAIAQFPAVLLAWLFGFKPGRGLRQLA